MTQKTVIIQMTQVKMMKATLRVRTPVLKTVIIQMTQVKMMKATLRVRTPVLKTVIFQMTQVKMMKVMMKVRTPVLKTVIFFQMTQVNGIALVRWPVKANTIPARSKKMTIKK